MKTLLDVAAFCLSFLVLALLVETAHREWRDRYYIQASAYGIPGGVARRWWWSRRIGFWSAVWLSSLGVMAWRWLA